MDRILFDKSEHSSELKKDLSSSLSISQHSKHHVVGVIRKYWDYFAKVGTKHTIISYEFGIDTSGTKPISCRKLSYGPYESRISMSQLEDLLSNKVIEECG